MFGFLRPDPKKKLQAEYEKKTAEAMRLQRSGDMAGYAAKTAEAEEIGKRLDQL